MRRLPKLSILTFCFLGISACATTHHRPSPPKSGEKPIEKEGQKLPPPVAEVPPTPATDLAGLSQRINNLQEPLSDSDIRDATQLYPTRPGTQEEGIFVLTQLRLFQKDLEKKTGFQSQDLYNQDAPAASAAGLSLEKRFQDLEVDLVAAIRSNAFLKNLHTLQLTQTLARNTQNSEAFRQNLQAAIQESGAQWAAELNQAPAATSPLSPLPSAEGTTAVPGTPTDAGAGTGVAISGESGTAAQGEADIAQSDSILVLAQKLADKGEYKEALEQTSRIPADDPFHAQALEKTKLYSNRAVQDLRQRAAEAFSNAMPMTDPKAKLNYLRQAKNLLEKALTDYPQADQLDTVRENLAVINHDLEAVDKSGS